MSGAHHASAAFLPWETTPVPFEHEAERALSSSGRFIEHKSLLPPLEFEP